MALSAELARMESDFITGRNPLAYIPLCNALRRQKMFTRALELCQRGLAGDPNSLAGRTLYCRLLFDLGHYEDALREVARAEVMVPEAQGLLLEKARCLIRLDRFEEAEAVLSILVGRNPLEPNVQLLSSQLRKARSIRNASRIGASADAQPRFVRLTNHEVLAQLIRHMRPHVKLVSCAVVPTGAGEPALEGDPEPAEAGYAFYRGVNRACKELEEGQFTVGLLETESAQLIVLVRKNTLVSLCIEPTPGFGKIYHRFLGIVSQLLPEANTESFGSL